MYLRCYLPTTRGQWLPASLGKNPKLASMFGPRVPDLHLENPQWPIYTLKLPVAVVTTYHPMHHLARGVFRIVLNKFELGFRATKL